MLGLLFPAYALFFALQNLLLTHNSTLLCLANQVAHHQLPFILLQTSEFVNYDLPNRGAASQHHAEKRAEFPWLICRY